MFEVIFFVGILIFFAGGIGLLIAAFRTGIIWGLAVLFIAPVALFYIIVHWHNAKGPFKLQMLGLIIILTCSYISDEVTIPSYISTYFPNITVTTFGNSVLSTNESNKISAPTFSCDGRQFCSQMNSRAEVNFFHKNCPNTKMDGDQNGLPCENDSRF